MLCADRIFNKFSVAADGLRPVVQGDEAARSRLARNKNTPRLYCTSYEGAGIAVHMQREASRDMQQELVLLPCRQQQHFAFYEVCALHFAVLIIDPLVVDADAATLQRMQNPFGWMCSLPVKRCAAGL